MIILRGHEEEEKPLATENEGQLSLITQSNESDNDNDHNDLITQSEAG